jgi:hypothetical protein
MRDLAAKKMGSPHLSYLFTNDLVVQKSIVSKCAGVVDTIKGKLTALNSVDGSFALEPSDGNGKYLTDSTPGAENICRVLFQALFAQAPERFGLLVAGSAPGVEPVVAPTYFDATDPVDLPFQIGDSIVFNVVMDNSQQDATRGWATAGSISNRTYKIRLILKKYVLGASSAPANAIADTLAAGTFANSLIVSGLQTIYFSFTETDVTADETRSQYFLSDTAVPNPYGLAMNAGQTREFIMNKTNFRIQPSTWMLNFDSLFDQSYPTGPTCSLEIAYIDQQNMKTILNTQTFEVSTIGTMNEPKRQTIPIQITADIIFTGKLFISILRTTEPFFGFFTTTSNLIIPYLN